MPSQTTPHDENDRPTGASFKLTAARVLAAQLVALLLLWLLQATYHG